MKQAMKQVVQKPAREAQFAASPQRDGPAPGLINARPTAAVQRRLADIIERGPAASAQRALNAQLNDSPRMVQRKQANLTGMPDQLKAGVESLSGIDMSQVRVHANSALPAQLDALAFAQGKDIHLGPGQEKHLPHEAWHSVQQMQGRVQPTARAGATAINDDPGLESEADTMGAKAAQLTPVSPLDELEPGAAQRQQDAPAQLISVELAPAGAPLGHEGAPIQLLRIEFRRGKIALPRIYQDPFDAEHYIVTDYAQEDINFYTEVNRMCNVMSVMWASRWGAPDAGFWGFGGADQQTMAEWAAADADVGAQTARAQGVLDAGNIGILNFNAVLGELTRNDTARGVLASQDHAVAFVIAGGRVRIYDSMEGAVTVNTSLAEFAGGFLGMAGMFAWNAAIVNCPTRS